MNLINYFTVNTKHNRVSNENEIGKDVLNDLRQITIEAQKEGGTELFDDTVFELTVEENSYMGTLSVKTGIGLVPVLITAGASTEHSRIYVWEEILKLRKKLIPFDTETIIFPAAPIIMDLVTPFAGKHIDIMGWTGDFSRCMGHILLGEYKR